MPYLHLIMKKKLLSIIFVLLLFEVNAGVKELLSALDTAKSEKAKVNILMDLSREYVGLDVEKSGNYAEEAYLIALKTNDTSFIVNCSFNLGYHYSVTGQESKALEILFDGLEYASKNGNDILSAKFYNNIANTFGMFQDFKSALKYYNLAFEISKKIDDPLLESRLTNNIGQAYHELDSLELALEYYFNALKINEIEKFDEGLLFNYSNIGNALLGLNQLEKAKNYLYIHNSLAKKFKNRIHILWSHEYLSKLYLKTNEYDIALNHSDSVIINSIKMNYMEPLAEAYRVRAEIHFNLKHYDKAYLDLTSRNKLTDSIHVKEVATIVEDAKIQYEYSKQIKMLNLENENAQLTHKKDQFSLIALLLILSVLILISFIIYKNNRNKITSAEMQKQIIENENESFKLKNQTISLELEKRNKELTSNVLHLSNLNNFINSVSDKLEEQKKNFKPENLKMVNKIIKTIQGNTDVNIWQEFELRFEKVHSGFYENLQKDHPKLTPNEKKLCAFLKLNMTSKDISGITGQSVHSIEVARTRLRKKLDLSNKEESLIDFIDKY